MINNFQENKSLASKLNFILPKKYRIAYLIYIFSLILGLLLQLIGISSLGPLFATYFGENINPSYFRYLDKIIDTSKFNLFSLILTFTTCSIIVSNLVFLFSAYLSAKIAFSIEINIRSKLFQFYIYNGYSNFIKTGSSSFLSLIVNETQRFTSQVLIPLADIISRLVLVIGIFVLLMMIAFKPTLLMIIFLSIFYITFFSNIRTRIKQNNVILTKENNGLIKTVSDIIKSFKEIKIYSLENKYLNNLTEIVTKIQKIRFFTTFFSISPRYYLEILLFLAIYIFFFINKSSSVNIVELTILPILVYSFFKILPSIQGAFAQYIVIRSNINSLNEIYKSMAMMKNNFKLKKNVYLTSLNTTEFKSLELKGINFNYNKKKIFEDLNFKIAKGEKIGIEGPSGVGKSTFLYILTGLLKADAGKIFINEFQSNSHDLLKKCKDSLAIIPQNASLMEDTILNNILLDKEFNQKKLDLALEFAEAKDFIQKLENNINTIVHSSNSNLSGGQIQRIAIARAIYRDPEILIIDEGFNQLDKQSELNLLKKLENQKNITVIMVYHKISDKVKLNKVYDITKFKLTLKNDK